jgi:hypothetical protein
LLPKPLKNFFKGLFGKRAGEVGEALVTTEGDEVKITGLLVALEADWHAVILLELGGSGRAVARCPLIA